MNFDNVFLHIKQGQLCTKYCKTLCSFQNFKFGAIIYIVTLSMVGNTYGQDAIYSSLSTHHPIIAKNGMVATQHVLATEIGLDILKNGGNAVDAAVGVGFALAVVLPRAGNLGGGGFMLYHDATSKETKAYNYREMAPKASHKDMYLDKKKNVDKTLFNQSYLSVGIPGTVAGLVEALEEHGTMSLEEILEPTIRLAEEGFPITHDLAGLLVKYEKRLKKCEASKHIFYPSDSTYYSAGDTLVQTDLAWSLRQIAQHGQKAFYNGALMKKLVKAINMNGGIMTNEDFNNYKVEERPPVSGEYRGHKILSMPPPSSGGVHVIQMLNILENYPIASYGHNSAHTIHLMSEAMKLAYADRSEHLGDPNFWDVPAEEICSQEYADHLNTKIDTLNATPSADIGPGNPIGYESEETTHFSVVDKWGNAVSNTYTLNFSFGTGLVAEGTGILLNNEMGDFSAKPGSPNAFGLLGGEANAVKPGKRPLSSMTPTIVMKDDELFLVTGSPGGSRIITTVLQVIMNVIDHDMNVAEATHASRIHHKWYPEKLYHEKTLNTDTRELLKQKGHEVSQRGAMGSTQSIIIKNGHLNGCSDPRRPDAKTLGF